MSDADDPYGQWRQDRATVLSDLIDVYTGEWLPMLETATERSIKQPGYVDEKYPQGKTTCKGRGSDTQAHVAFEHRLVWHF